MNAAMRLLYRGGAWLPSADARAISQHGLQHLRSVSKCAQLSLTMRQPRFPIHSKMHMLHHTFQFLAPWLRGLGFPLSWPSWMNVAACLLVASTNIELRQNFLRRCLG